MCEPFAVFAPTFEPFTEACLVSIAAQGGSDVSSHLVAELHNCYGVNAHRSAEARQRSHLRC